MNKKVVAVLLGVLSVLCFTGCNDSEEKSKPYLERFILLTDETAFSYGLSYGAHQKIVVDKETRIIYLYDDDFFVYLVDEEGKPLLYEGDLE